MDKEILIKEKAWNILKYTHIHLLFTVVLKMFVSPSTKDFK